MQRFLQAMKSPVRFPGNLEMIPNLTLKTSCLILREIFELVFQKALVGLEPSDIQDGRTPSSLLRQWLMLAYVTQVNK